MQQQNKNNFMGFDTIEINLGFDYYDFLINSEVTHTSYRVSQSVLSLFM